MAFETSPDEPAEIHPPFEQSPPEPDWHQRLGDKLAHFVFDRVFEPHATRVARRNKAHG
jgi:hypothetical protein